MKNISEPELGHGKGITVRRAMVGERRMAERLFELAEYK
jgi:hypothetical protein